MKRSLLVLHIVLILLFGGHVYTLWSQLTQQPAESIEAVNFAVSEPPAFKLALHESYPSLFDVKALPKKSETDGNRNGDQDEVRTDKGLMRLRAVFAVSGERLALLEIHAAGSPTLIEARENNAIQGFKVLDVGPRYIQLKPEKGGDPRRLVIFNRESNHLRYQKSSD